MTIFTPDDTHFTIAMAAVNAGMHVLIAKPLVKTLKEHHELLAAARANNVLCVVEVHKRFDPFYTDARDRIASLGDFSYMVRAWPGGHVHPLFSFPRVPVSVKPQTSLFLCFCIFLFCIATTPPVAVPSRSPCSLSSLGCVHVPAQDAADHFRVVAG